MNRLVLLSAVLNTVTAPSISITDTPNLEVSTFTTVTMPPTVFKSNLPPTSVRKQSGGKADSPMLNYIFDSYATSNKHFHDMFRAPSFEGDLSKDTMVFADTDTTVVFNCQVSSLRDKTVSWIKVSDEDNLELLTLDLETHTADNRFRVDVAGEVWTLALSNAKPQDSGIYCCHVSTHPPMLKRFKLVVHQPTMRLSKEAFLESGETLSLKCAILHLNPGTAEPVLRWFRNNSTKTIDEVRGGVLVETDHLTLTSHLQIARLKTDDAGNYSCVLDAPMKMRAFSRVHVLQGSSLAELQSGVKTTSSYTSILLTFLILFFHFADIR